MTFLNDDKTNHFIDRSFFINIGVTNIRHKAKVFEGRKGTFCRELNIGKKLSYLPRRTTHNQGGIKWYFLGTNSGFSGQS